MAEPSGHQISRRALLTGAAVAISAAAVAACSDTRARPSSQRTGPSTTTDGTAVAASTTTMGVAGPAAAVAHGPRDGSQIALTFHLGPHLASQDVALTEELLAATKRLQAPITVFAVGQWLDQHPDLVPLILAGGHELDNHTFSHPTLTQLNAAQVSREIVGCRDVLARLAPNEGRYFRPSGTSQATPLILTQAGGAGYRTVVDFDVDPLDYTDPGADAIVSAVRADLQPGSIVSLHFGHAGTIEALPLIIDTLQARSLQPVLLRELVA